LLAAVGFGETLAGVGGSGGSELGGDGGSGGSGGLGGLGASVGSGGSGGSGGPGVNGGRQRCPYDNLLSRGEREPALTRLLRREEVITSADLLRLGFSKTEVRGLVKRGALVRLYRGVYVDGRTRTTPWVRLKAALLAAGPTAFLSHRTAAAARGYRSINTREIHVSVVADRTPKIPGLFLHRTIQPARGEISTVGGLRASTVPRILVEIAADATLSQLDELITAAERRGALDPRFMATVLERHAGQPGMPQLRAALHEHVSTPEHNSGLEDEVWAWWATQPDLPPPDETNVHIGGHEYDGLWHRERLVLEIDSRDYHQARADMEKDRIKDIEIQKLGLRVMRVTALRFEHDKAGIREDFLVLIKLVA
jgi:hypothetical protein